ncbi:MAG TPA: hypothetical protein IAC00_05480 [Candidatus Limivicinus faecipullorum]|nr:hypothetical protein [Candidatus Limivicinus faecipullorum]
MKKKSFRLLALLALSLSLAACSKGGSALGYDSQVTDAAELSEKIVPPSYRLKEEPTEGGLWLSHNLTAWGDKVFYIGSDSRGYHVCRYEPETGGGPELYSSAEYILFDLSLSPEGELFLLAAPAAQEDGYEILRLDGDGNLTGTWALDALDTAEALAPRELEYAGGRLFILGQDMLISLEVGDSLKPGPSLELGPGALLSRSSGGELLLAYAKGDAYTLELYSPEKLELLASADFNLSFIALSGGLDGKIFLDSGSALYCYGFDTGELSKLFSWSSLGILRGGVAETGAGLVCTGRLSANRPCAPLLLVPGEAGATGSVIRFATTDPGGLDPIIQGAIRDWNIQNPGCPIEVVDYSVYGAQDSSLSSAKLLADMVAGDIPDIYDFSLSSIDTIPSSAQFARRGLLEDLYPYIDSDPELSREDFIPGVMSAMEIDGGLYELVPSFSLVTTFASSRALGDTTRLTYDDLNFMAANSEDFDSVFDKHRGRIWLLGNILDASGSKLVDWSKGECYFDSDYFRSLLETMKAMPEEKEDLPSPTLYKSVSMSRGLLYYVITNDLWMASTAPLAYGEDYCFPGLPELGSAIYPNCCYGISAYSQNKELCWQFLRQFLTREYGSRFYLSPRKDALAQRVEETWTGFGPEVQQYNPQGLEAMEKLRDIAMNCSTVMRHDPEIWQIVYSQSLAYFAGDKSLEETADQIQSRVSLYMAEQG